VPAYAELGVENVAAFRVAMVNDSEAILLWAFPDWSTWSTFEQRWLVGGHGEALDGGPLAAWRTATLAMGADWRRSLLADSPLNPLRIGRQPEAADRIPLDQL
jgi:hypothetical protein